MICPPDFYVLWINYFGVCFEKALLIPVLSCTESDLIYIYSLQEEKVSLSKSRVYLVALSLSVSSSSYLFRKRILFSIYISLCDLLLLYLCSYSCMRLHKLSHPTPVVNAFSIFFWSICNLFLFFFFNSLAFKISAGHPPIGSQPIYANSRPSNNRAYSTRSNGDEQR